MSGGYPPGVTQWHIDYYAGADDEPNILLGEYCEGGVIIGPEPRVDDPYAEREIGSCPRWPGCGCQWDLPAPEGDCETANEDDLDEWWGEGGDGKMKMEINEPVHL